MYIIEFYSVVNKIEIRKFTGKWMELENTILRWPRTTKTNTACSLSYVDLVPIGVKRLQKSNDTGRRKG